MYGEAPDNNGWDKTGALTGNKINEDIIDPVNQNSKGTKIPRVSIPSPFARFDLVQKAFANVTRDNDSADIRDKILVSHALDCLQLFYENNPKFRIIPWRKKIALEDLLKSGYQSHRLVGETLDLYMRQENYGLDERSNYSANSGMGTELTLYFLTYDNEPIAVTSPTSIFLATPNFGDFKDIFTIDSGRKLFDVIKPNLIDRDEEFALYVAKLVAYFEKTCRGQEDKVLAPLQAFRDYLAAQKSIIRRQNPDRYRRFVEIEEIREPEDLMVDYQRSESEVYLLGMPLYVRRSENIQLQVSEVSDFVVNTTKTNKKPLILTNNHNAPGWVYTSMNAAWDTSANLIDYTKRRAEDRTYLPGTEIEYADGWLSEHDFLSDVIVQVPYEMDSTKFFNGNLQGANGFSFLLPIKRKFFEYFSIDYLKAKDGRDDNFKLEVRKSKTDSSSYEVVATLRIPVSRGKSVYLQKTYVCGDDHTFGLEAYPDSKDKAMGYIVECPTEVSIMPFVKMNSNNIYTIQLMRNGWESFQANLKPYRTNKSGADQFLEWKGNESTRPTKTKFYSLHDSFDYLVMEISQADTSAYRYNRIDEAVLIPNMPKYEMANKQFQFAFDFGTSNSHIAVRDTDGDMHFLELKLNESIGSTLQANFDKTKNIHLQMFDVRYKQEFIPKEGLGSNYKFPVASALLVPLSIRNMTIRGLHDGNIPFIYGREDYNETDNKVVTNLKWKEDGDGYGRGYIEEMVLLARNFAIENRADLSKCTITWTYPLSMNSADVESYNEMWQEFYQLYFNANEQEVDTNVKRMTESIAPILYYRDNNILLEEFNLSVDIGGGTCDVVLYNTREDIKLTSFRFGADNIFGVGSNKDVDMIMQAFEYFIKKYTDITGSAESVIVKELRRVSSKQTNASEANGRLFGLESHRSLLRLDVKDKSYNLWLSQHKEYRLIFLYYYSAIIYYLTKLMVSNGYTQKPVAISFSGTGSKLLNIIGGNAFLSELTSTLIEGFSKGLYKYPEESISITIERKEPKQLTAKGALSVAEFAKDISRKFTPKYTKKMMLSQPMSSIVENEDQGQAEDEKGKLKYRHLQDKNVLGEIVESVDQFNRVFYNIMKNNLDDFHLDEDTLKDFYSKYVQSGEATDKLMAYINTEITSRVRKNDFENRADRDFEDSPFFYPIKGVISSMLKSR